MVWGYLGYLYLIKCNAKDFKYIFFYFSLKPSAINDRFVIELDKIINLIYSVFIIPILGGNLSNIIFKNFNFADLKILVLILFSITIFFIVSLVYCLRKKDQALNSILLTLHLVKPSTKTLTVPSGNFKS